MSANMPAMVETLETKDFSYLFEGLQGISEKQLKQHNKLYEGYVAKYNEVNEKLKTADRLSANQNYSEYRSLKTEFAHNLNGAILHEMYFSNLTTDYKEPSGDLEDIVSRYFGTWDDYIKDLKAAGMASRAGWAATVFNYRDGKLYNCIIDQHNINVPTCIRFVLIMDTWEHAFMIDYGTDKKSYINAFLDNVNWKVMEDRLNSALMASDMLGKATE